MRELSELTGLAPGRLSRGSALERWIEARGADAFELASFARRRQGVA